MHSGFPNFKQRSKYDCGLTCLRIISKFYEKDTDFYKYENFIDPNKGGISLYDLRRIAENEGYVASTFKCKAEELKRISRPLVIIFHKHHYVILYKVKRGRYYISDPQKGLYILDKINFIESFIDRASDKGTIMDLSISLASKEKRSDIDAAWSFLKNYLFPHKRDLVNIFLIMFFISLIYAIMPFISRSIIDVGINQNDLDFVFVLLIANICLIIFKAVGDWLKTSTNTFLSNKIKISISADYLQKVFNLPIRFFDRMLFGDIIQRAQDQDRIQSFITNSGISIVMSFMIIFLYSIILLSFNTTLFFIFFLLSTLYIISISSFFGIKKKMDIDLFQVNAENQSLWIENMRNLEDIKLNNYSGERRKKWEILQDKIHHHAVKSMNIDRTQNLVSELISSIKDIAITFYAAKLVINGQISFGTLISIQFIIGQLKLPLQEIVNFIKGLQTAYVSFTRTNEIHSADNDQGIDGKAISLNTDNLSISFKNVFFKYDEGHANVLNNISFTVEKNKKIAIVGKSGCGKTTILKLIAKVYDDYAGNIFIGSLDLKKVENAYWRKILGVAFNESNLYKDTILNNIVLGDLRNMTREKVNNSVVNTNLGPELSKFPLGLSTPLKENGGGLSQGQKQRLLLARAIYKEPEILLLDEATNSLDPISESIVLDYLSTVKKTMVFVSHKLSTIRVADEILVMDRGFIVERGVFQELRDNKNSFFFSLFKNQLGEYEQISN